MASRPPTTQPPFSGGAWWHRYEAAFPNSQKVSDLAEPFQTKVNGFLAALASAGAQVSIGATRRNAHRAYLMHYSWMIARRGMLPASVPKDDAVDIVWDHGNLAESQSAAATMVALFGIRFQPSLTSLHIEGRAIDMDIDWSGKLSIADAKGRMSTVDKPHNDSNADLHLVGASYGVHKLLTDPPHWSDNGH